MTETSTSALQFSSRRLGAASRKRVPFAALDDEDPSARLSTPLDLSNLHEWWRNTGLRSRVMKNLPLARNEPHSTSTPAQNLSSPTNPRFRIFRRRSRSQKEETSLSGVEVVSDPSNNSSIDPEVTRGSRGWRNRTRLKPDSSAKGREVTAVNAESNVGASKGRFAERQEKQSVSLGNSLARQQPQQKTRAHQNAMAGASAGVMVSICLHPIDTVKVLIQSQSSSIRQIPQVLSKFVASRGLGSLYSGLATNLASSAPTSAIYTTTYEAVKETLLPRLSQEKAWVAHSVAGGMASVATSFVYTPSECIKQRMQVQSHPNTWSALTTIVRSDGPLGLWRGWTAVLARNIPHSAIKFFAFERMKSAIIARKGPEQPQSLSAGETLMIGGVAGSTAAFFTTPFDVIKTRLQTQAALGHATQYTGVVDALTKMIAREGVGSLYRGLTPRLLIYISQGAIFFASYEFMKQVVSAKVPKLHSTTPKAAPEGQIV